MTYSKEAQLQIKIAFLANRVPTVWGSTPQIKFFKLHGYESVILEVGEISLAALKGRHIIALFNFLGQASDVPFSILFPYVTFNVTISLFLTFFNEKGPVFKMAYHNLPIIFFIQIAGDGS